MSDNGFAPDLKLDGVSWLFAVAKLVGQLFVPLVALVFFGIRDEWSLWAGLGVVPLLATALWRQWTYRYGFGERGLVIHEGVFFRSKRQIDYSRIENIATHQNLLHRVLDVAEVRVETSTGGSAEAAISVLGLGAIDDLRTQLFERARAAREQFGGSQPEPQSPTAQPASETLLHLGPVELVRYGLTANRGMLVVATFFGFYSQSGLLKGIQERLEKQFESLPWERLFALDWTARILLGVALLVAAIAAMRFLSVLLALVTLHDFTLLRQQKDLHIRYGLLTRVAFVLRVPRIQVVRKQQSLLQRLMERVSLSIDLAGATPGTQEGQGRHSVRWLAPICTLPRARELIAIALPSIDISEEPDWQPLAPHARRRMFRTRLIWFLPLILIPTLIFARSWTPIVPILLMAVVALSWASASLRFRYTRWALTAKVLYVQTGWLTRRLVIAPRDRLQVAQVSISPFDRRWKMATVLMDTAGATFKFIRISYLPVTTAQWLAGELYRTPSAEIR